MAQDFRTAFGLGDKETTITAVDADGVALAAIQGLNAKLLKELKHQHEINAALEKEMAEIKDTLKLLMKIRTDHK